MDLTPDFKEFIELLNSNKVKYMVTGGYAVAYYGYPRHTGDIDFWIENSLENAQKIENTLLQFGFGSLDIDVEDFQKPDYIVQLGFQPNRIDIITGISGVTFSECWEERK